MAGGSEDRGGFVDGDESLRFDLVAFVAVTQSHVLASVVLPGVTERLGSWNQEDRGRSVLECGFQLGSVSPVEGQGLAEEDTFVESGRVTAVRDRRIARDDHDSLPLHVDPGVVVPLVSGATTP